MGLHIIDQADLDDGDDPIVFDPVGGNYIVETNDGKKFTITANLGTKPQNYFDLNRIPGYFIYRPVLNCNTVPVSILTDRQFCALDELEKETVTNLDVEKDKHTKYLITDIEDLFERSNIQPKVVDNEDYSYLYESKICEDLCSIPKLYGSADPGLRGRLIEFRLSVINAILVMSPYIFTDSRERAVQELLKTKEDPEELLAEIIKLSRVAQRYGFIRDYVIKRLSPQEQAGFQLPISMATFMKKVRRVALEGAFFDLRYVLHSFSVPEEVILECTNSEYTKKKVGPVMVKIVNFKDVTETFNDHDLKQPAITLISRAFLRIRDAAAQAIKSLPGFNTSELPAIFTDRFTTRRIGDTTQIDFGLQFLYDILMSWSEVEEKAAKKAEESTAAAKERKRRKRERQKLNKQKKSLSDELDQGLHISDKPKEEKVVGQTKTAATAVTAATNISSTKPKNSPQQVPLKPPPSQYLDPEVNPIDIDLDVPDHLKGSQDASSITSLIDKVSDVILGASKKKALFLNLKEYEVIEKYKTETFAIEASALLKENMLRAPKKTSDKKKPAK